MSLYIQGKYRIIGSGHIYMKGVLFPGLGEVHVPFKRTATEKCAFHTRQRSSVHRQYIARLSFLLSTSMEIYNNFVPRPVMKNGLPENLLTGPQFMKTYFRRLARRLIEWDLSYVP